MAVQMSGQTISDTKVRLVHQSGAEIMVSAPADNGGDGSGFSPTDLCAVSLGACGSMIMKMFAANRGLAVRSIDVAVTKEMSAAPRRIQRVTVAYTIAGHLDASDQRRLEAAGRSCPVRLTLGEGVEVAEVYSFVE